MGLISSIFTWWNGATAGTYWTTWRSGTFVGEDTQGNRYYRNADNSRRWVIYKGLAEPSRIPPEWHHWLHHIDEAEMLAIARFALGETEVRSALPSAGLFPAPPTPTDPDAA